MRLDHTSWPASRCSNDIHSGERLALQYIRTLGFIRRFYHPTRLSIPQYIIHEYLNTARFRIAYMSTVS